VDNYGGLTMQFVIHLRYYYFLIIIYNIYTGSKYLWPVQFIRSKLIEPAVQPVLNGWTNEPVNR